MDKKLYYVDSITAGTNVAFLNCKFTNFIYKEDYSFKKITYNGTPIVMYRNGNYLSLQVSLPKLVLGNNANLQPLDNVQVQKAMDILNSILFAETKINLDFSVFKISRIEISHNYICKPESKQSHIELLKKCNVVKRKSETYSTSVVFKNKSRRTTIYDKFQEILDRPFSNRNVKSNICSGIVRIEHKLYKKQILKYSKSRVVGDFLGNVNFEKILKQENEIVGLNLKMLSENQFYKTLKKHISQYSLAKQKRVLEFYNKLNIFGFENVSKAYSKYQVREYIKILKSKGISPLFMTGINTRDIIDFNIFHKNRIILNKEEIRRIINAYKQNEKFFLDFLCGNLKVIKYRLKKMTIKYRYYYVNDTS